jgi:hypothetical protein
MFNSNYIIYTFKNLLFIFENDTLQFKCKQYAVFKAQFHEVLEHFNIFKTARYRY